MINETTFYVDGDPIPQPRHRYMVRGGFAHSYDPSAKQKMNFVKSLICNDGKRPRIFTEAIEVHLLYVIKRPKSHYGTGKNKDVLKNGVPTKHTSKPDIDNFVKFTLDALNGVLWEDDSSIYRIEAEKRYAYQGEETRTIITIYSRS